MAPFQNMKLYWKIHIFMCVKEERYDGRWGTLLFQPNGLGLTDISVSMHCSLCAVTAQGYGANHGLQLKGISRLLQLVERLRALRGRCAEHQELAAGVTRGPGNSQRDGGKNGSVCAWGHWRWADSDTRYRADWESQVSSWRAAQMVFPLVDLHPGLLVVNRAKLLAMLMFPADNLQP